MSLKNLFSWIIAGLGFALILFYLFNLQKAFSSVLEPGKTYQAIKNYQISIWCGWLLITSSAIYNRWKKNNHILFAIDYFIMVTAFIFLGYYLNLGVEIELWGVGDFVEQRIIFIILKNILLICLMTAFIHIAIWWFSKRWHRK